jgi:hypothetical protein
LVEPKEVRKKKLEIHDDHALLQKKTGLQNINISQKTIAVTFAGWSYVHSNFESIRLHIWHKHSVLVPSSIRVTQFQFVLDILGQSPLYLHGNFSQKRHNGEKIHHHDVMAMRKQNKTKKYILWVKPK